jgi:Rod binding domain-containing protein
MATSAVASFGPAPALKAATISPAAAAKARATAQDFEAVFLNAMFSQMSTGVGDGPFNGGEAAKTWRSMLTDEYANNFAKAGGIGIANSVYKELIALQEARAK